MTMTVAAIAAERDRGTDLGNAPRNDDAQRSTTAADITRNPDVTINVDITGNPDPTGSVEDVNDGDTAEGRADDAQASAWTTLSRLYARVTRRLTETLDDNSCIPHATFEVLALVDRSGGSIRLTDLLQDVTMSQPGLSRKIERLCAQGLLERATDAQDRRATLISLTPAGRAALDQALPVHRAEIIDYFTRTIGPDELNTLRFMLERALPADQH